MSLNPQTEQLLRQMEQEQVPDISEMDVPRARKFLEEAFGEAGAEEVARVHSLTVPGPAGRLPVRIYDPGGDGRRPLLVFYHGGGWVIGNIESHDPVCRALARASGYAVASVEYRLAPESAFPAAPEDCYAATRWLAGNAREMGYDASRLVVAGDSAGGNLAAVVALMARRQGGPEISRQVLIYPAVDLGGRYPSHEENGEGYFLTTAAMEWFVTHYIQDEAAAKSWMASPLLAEDHSGLPPAVVLTAGFDPLRDEGRAYARKLREAGVKVEEIRHDDQIHGFVSMLGLLDDARSAIEELAERIR
ncbi:alpha/beta hydrolase [Rubrobacter calidifluminis]|uniref:alpha/beta hydrolase n=1 Tax=Rubrobacter calidifluminis TaxID=1392640 RepID=UPI0023604FBB|nr:alpha/beta hydrolase [Rubrobacter calidifluminis]